MHKHAGFLTVFIGVQLGLSYYWKDLTTGR